MTVIATALIVLNASMMYAVNVNMKKLLKNKFCSTTFAASGVGFPLGMLMAITVFLCISAQ